MADEPASDYPKARLSAALEDARVLLAYASQSGAQLDAGVVQAIVDTGALAAQGALTPAREASFWTSLNTLAKSLSPVSVSSLRATMDSFSPAGAALFGFGGHGAGTGGRSLARRTVRWYTGILVVTLGILLVLQIYWLFGTAMTGDIQRIAKETADVQAKERLLRQQPSAESDKDESRAENPERTRLAETKLNLELQEIASYNLLGQWSGAWNRWVPVNEICKGSQKKNLQQCENISRYQASLVVLEVLQRYVLALLYGLLGACAYILRTLATEIRARVYSEASNIGFRIRLCLGTLGGMVIAWFVAPEAASGLFRTLSPFAFAFLAGYSVELLFAAMDKLIGAFTNK